MHDRLVQRTLYRLVEAVTPGRGITRKINGAPIAFPPSYWRFFPREYQVDTFRFVAEASAPGTIAVDVGAHIGLFTIPMAKGVGPTGGVIAFEPVAANRRVLEEMLRLNGCDHNVEVRAEAVADFTGSARFVPGTGPLPVESRLEALPADADSASESVPVLSIDALLASSEKPVSLVKIDAEGHERAVLAGAAAVLEQWRPKIALDVHPFLIPEGGLAALWQLIGELGYDVWADRARLDRADFIRSSPPFDVQLLPRP